MLTGDKPGEVKVEDKGGKLADWFKGESEPVNIGIVPSPAKEKSDPFGTMHASSSSLTINHTKRASASETAARPSVLSTGTFSFFKVRSSPLEQQSSSSYASNKSFATMNAGLASSPQGVMDPYRSTLGDEFTKMNIGQALYPTGVTDPISPSSFNHLMQNAEWLLTSMQTTYKKRTTILEKLTLENDAQTDELKSAKSRVEQLETRLESMAVEAVERDNIVMNLVDELANEKQLRHQEAEARKCTIKLVTDPQTKTVAEGLEESSGRPRQSGFSTASDSGFESDGESFDDSILKESRPRSPSFSSVSSLNSPEMRQSPELAYGQVARKRSMPPLTPLWTTDGTTKKDVQAGCGVPRKGSYNCQHLECLHCRGLGASDAWGVANMLSGENKMLKQQVEVMQRALKDCLGSL